RSSASQWSTKKETSSIVGGIVPSPKTCPSRFTSPILVTPSSSSLALIHALSSLRLSLPQFCPNALPPPLFCPVLSPPKKGPAALVGGIVPSPKTCPSTFTSPILVTPSSSGLALIHALSSLRLSLPQFCPNGPPPPLFCPVLSPQKKMRTSSSTP